MEKGSSSIGKEKKESETRSRKEMLEERQGKASMDSARKKKKISFKDNESYELREVTENMKIKFIQEIKRIKEKWENRMKAE